MRTWTGIAGLFFGASLAVYSGPANRLFAAVTVGKEGAAKNDVKMIDDAAAATTAAPAAAAASASVDPFAVTPPATLGATKDGDTALTNPSVVPLGDSVPSTNPTTAPAANAGQSISASQVSVSDAGTVEIHVNDANLLEVLRMLSLQSQRNIIASKEVTGTVTANLYNVTVREALDAILHANGYAYRERDNFIYVYTAKELIEMDKEARQLSTQVFHLYYTPAANAVNMIKPVLSTESQVAFTAAATSGIDQTGTKDTGGNSHATEDTIVVTDYTDNLEKVKRIIKDIDRRPQQVLVEATILSATLSDNNALGVDFSVMGGVKFDQILGTPASTINSASTGNLTSGAGGPGKGGYGIGKTDFTSQLPAGGMRIGVLTNNLSVFLQALESVTNTTVLSNPKVLALDKQKGEVNVGAQLGYKTTTTSSTTTTETVAFLPTGTRLIFRPFIGDDGFIRLEIHPEDSSGTIDAAGVPQVTTTEVTSNVMVKDGHTIVIGGLFRDVSSASRGQVPGIGNIPFLGALFRQQQDSTQREEVIILLTPHIIKDDAAYSALSEEQQKRIEDYRVGVRKGMMIWGRERLAETAYQNALASLREPNPNRGMAMWHLNNATNLNPQFVEAMELKEKISGREVTASDNSSIRQFVSKAIISDQGTLQTPPPVMDIMPRRSTTMPTSTAGVATSQPAAVTPVAAVPIMEQFPATQPTTEPSLVELTDATTQPTSQPAVAEDDGGTAPTSTVTAISDDASAQPATQPSGGDELVRAAKALAEAAGHMANAADDLAHYAEVQPGHAKPSAMPTTRRTSKPSNGGTVTVVPLDDGNGN